MESRPPMEPDCCQPQPDRDCGCCQQECQPKPGCVNVPCLARQNPHFRMVCWTGRHLQMTLMTLPPCCDIGPELHADTDQIIRVEEGCAQVCMGGCRENPECRCCLHSGEAALVPAGTWHNVCNVGNCPLRLSSIYAPPQHPQGTIHHTKADSR